MITLDTETIIQMHKMILATSGGLDGVRDYGLLDMCVKSCYQTFDSVDLYPTIEEKSAHLGYSLITNHAFFDGNKRIGILAMLTFLEVNNIKLNYTDKDIIKLGFLVAKGETKYTSVLEWINNHKTKKRENYK